MSLNALESWNLCSDLGEMILLRGTSNGVDDEDGIGVGGA